MLYVAWMNEEEIIDIIKTTWTLLQPIEGSFVAPHFVKNFSRVKNKIKEWDFKKRETDE